MASGEYIQNEQVAVSRNQNDLKQVESEHLAEMPIKLAEIHSSCD